MSTFPDSGQGKELSRRRMYTRSIITSLSQDSSNIRRFAAIARTLSGEYKLYAVSSMYIVYILRRVYFVYQKY